MTLEEAIKENKETLQREAMSPVHLSRRAAKLGIEALERIRHLRQQSPQLRESCLSKVPTVDELLPSESEEEK